MGAARGDEHERERERGGGIGRGESERMRSEGRKRAAGKSAPTEGKREEGSRLKGDLVLSESR